MQTGQTNLPADHSERMKRALLSLDGLSIGDGFGDMFFTTTDSIERRLEYRDPPRPPWTVTDDTMMALSIVRCLKRCGHIEQDALATAFAQEYMRDPNRGYGAMARQILCAISEGLSWKEVSRRAFGGQGSCGNGGAMRSAPVGAYFADDCQRVVYEANASAEVTHAHPDGKTGAAAVALAAAWMVRERKAATKPSHALIEFVLEHIPQTETFHTLKKALEVPLELSPRTAVSILGNGTGVISSDTVPFCLWCAARHANSYTDALWTTVSGLGDRDTTCAISIVAVLKSQGFIQQDALAKRFARRFERDPDRGYGKMTRIQMREIMAGAKWRDTAANAFDGQGSMGNGSAMRVAPLGAYFAADLERCAEEARASSLVTHTHPEGAAGAVAVAVAAAMAWQLRTDAGGDCAQPLFDAVLRHTPESQVRRGILLASTTPTEIPIADVARALGNGSLVTAPDTVPFCVWMAAHHLDRFVEALGKTISVGGDCDTNAAIVCGIVALSVGRDSLPVEWLKAREPIHI